MYLVATNPCGTRKGGFFGVPPTGKPIRVKDGQIVEEYGQPDLLGPMRQIGALPLQNQPID